MRSTDEVWFAGAADWYRSTNGVDVEFTELNARQQQVGARQTHTGQNRRAWSVGAECDRL